MSYEMAVALICPVGHREATLKSHFPKYGMGAFCSRCPEPLEVEREALVRVQEMAESRQKRVIYRRGHGTS